jgi:O-acetylhomoserine/O-acetylserine sulfhydrylase-like pyridoxal-dependent enzyme
MDPAALAYQRALAFGYKKPAAAEQQNRAPDGKFAPSDLTRVAAGQAASKTLAGGGAREGGVVIDAKALAAMSEGEFEEFRTKNPRAYDRLMGRDAAYWQSLTLIGRRSLPTISIPYCAWASWSAFGALTQPLPYGM